MITKNRDQVPCLYLFLYSKLREKSKINHGLFIQYKYVVEIFGRNLHQVPRIFYSIILKEMEDLKLLRRVGGKSGGRAGYRYEFLRKDIDKLLNQYFVF